jgi:hypothetical protein
MNRGFVPTLIATTWQLALTTSHTARGETSTYMHTDRLRCKLAIVLINRRAARHRNYYDEDRHAREMSGPDKTSPKQAVRCETGPALPPSDSSAELPLQSSFPKQSCTDGFAIACLRKRLTFPPPLISKACWPTESRDRRRGYR